MGLRESLRRILSGSPWDGTAGRPPSGNGASSFHLFWDVPSAEAADRWIGAEATLEIVEPPAVDALHFWALQVSFGDGAGSSGAAHLGLQWFGPHPGGTAVNWGGYRSAGGELDGSHSALPSATGNPNTRDFPWITGRSYRLRIMARSGAGPRGTTAWSGEVIDETTGVATTVRELWSAGDRIDTPMVWSEVFAACDDPRSAVRWSELAVIAASGRRVPVDTVRVNYQALPEGGCAATDVHVLGNGFVQATSTPRATPPGSALCCNP